MKFIQSIFKTRILLLLAVLGLAIGMTGCATDEPENVSSKPWNSPENYQNGGLPSALSQPH